MRSVILKAAEKPASIEVPARFFAAFRMTTRRPPHNDRPTTTSSLMPKLRSLWRTAAGNAQPLGRSRLVAVGFPEHAGQEVPLQPLHGLGIQIVRPGLMFGEKAGEVGGRPVQRRRLHRPAAAEELRRQKLGHDHRAGGQQHGLLQHALQLADVARPR